MIKDQKTQTLVAAEAGHIFADFLFAINPNDLNDAMADKFNKAITSINDAQNHLYPRTATDRKKPIIPQDPDTLQNAALKAALNYANALEKIDDATYTHNLSDHIEQVQYRISCAMNHVFGIEK